MRLDDFKDTGERKAASMKSLRICRLGKKVLGLTKKALFFH
jgi:hypothetical protein